MIRTVRDMIADALYVRIAPDDVAVAHTDEIDVGTFVDLDANGDVVGIEVIRPGRPWPLQEVLDRYAISEEDKATLNGLQGLSHSGGGYASAEAHMTPVHAA